MLVSPLRARTIRRPPAGRCAPSARGETRKLADEHGLAADPIRELATSWAMRAYATVRPGVLASREGSVERALTAGDFAVR